MTNWGEVSLSAFGAYVLGCFATGYYLVRAVRGTDVRTVASGSVGARNVSRVLGRAGFFLTTLGDALKGSLAVWAARHFFPDDRLAIAALLAVVAGHIWPVQLRFRGGKGVATSIGALLVYDWRLVVVYVAVFAGGLLMAWPVEYRVRRHWGSRPGLFHRRSKTVLPGLFAYGCLPAAAFWLHHDGFELALLTCLAGMIGFAHRSNLADEIPALATRRGTTPKSEHTDS